MSPNLKEFIPRAFFFLIKPGEDKTDMSSTNKSFYIFDEMFIFLKNVTVLF